MKQKITESQLRNMISKAITENLNELSPEYLKQKAYDLSGKAYGSRRSKFDRKWLHKKVDQTQNILNYASSIREKEKEEYKEKVLSGLQDGIYVTAFFNDNLRIEFVGINNKEDAAENVAYAKYGEYKERCDVTYAQVKGPFNTYKEAYTWVNSNKLRHYYGWDSEEFQKALKARAKQEKNTIALSNIEVEPFEDEEDY